MLTVVHYKWKLFKVLPFRVQRDGYPIQRCRVFLVHPSFRGFDRNYFLGLKIYHKNSGKRFIILTKKWCAVFNRCCKYSIIVQRVLCAVTCCFFDKINRFTTFNAKNSVDNLSTSVLGKIHFTWNFEPVYGLQNCNI